MSIDPAIGPSYVSGAGLPQPVRHPNRPQRAQSPAAARASAEEAADAAGVVRAEQGESLSHQAGDGQQPRNAQATAEDDQQAAEAPRPKHPDDPCGARLDLTG